MLTTILSATLTLTVHVDSRFTELRDEGICNIGWVAGNSYGHPIWPQIRDFVGEGGTYYDAFVRIRAPGENAEQAAYSNVALYNECREQGRQQNFNEGLSINKIQRAIDISNELTNMLQ